MRDIAQEICSEDFHINVDTYIGNLLEMNKTYIQTIQIISQCIICILVELVSRYIYIYIFNLNDWDPIEEHSRKERVEEENTIFNIIE